MYVILAGSGLLRHRTRFLRKKIATVYLPLLLKAFATKNLFMWEMCTLLHEELPPLRFWIVFYTESGGTPSWR